MCVQKVYTYNNNVNSIRNNVIKYNVYIAILTLTSEYRGTVTNLQQSSEQPSLETRGVEK